MHKRFITTLLILIILNLNAVDIKAKDIPDSTVINNFYEYSKIINSATQSLQPTLKLIINNFDEKIYSPQNLKIDGIRNISLKGTNYNNIAEITIEIVYKQEFRIRQSRKNSLAFERLTYEDHIVIKRAEEIIKEIIKDNMTDYEKELAIHDYLVLNSKYDHINYLNNTIPESSYTIYGLFMNGKGVCQAYSEATKLLLNMVGIECEIVEGTANSENHEWNLVKLDGDYYMLDVTWDDPYPDEKGKVKYDYFNLTNDEMAKTHKWNTNRWPIAQGTKYNFYVYKSEGNNGSN